MYSKSDLLYSNIYSFDKYYGNSKKLDDLSLESKYSFLAEFFKTLNTFNKLKTQNEKTKKKKRNVYIQLHNYIMTC